MRWVKSSQGIRRGTCGWITSFIFFAQEIAQRIVHYWNLRMPRKIRDFSGRKKCAAFFSGSPPLFFQKRKNKITISINDYSLSHSLSYYGPVVQPGRTLPLQVPKRSSHLRVLRQAEASGSNVRDCTLNVPAYG